VDVDLVATGFPAPVVLRQRRALVLGAEQDDAFVEAVRSVSIAWVRRYAEPIGFAELATVIEATAPG
jgi:hypothetical protein